MAEHETRAELLERASTFFQHLDIHEGSPAALIRDLWQALVTDPCTADAEPIEAALDPFGDDEGATYPNVPETCLECGRGGWMLHDLDGDSWCVHHGPFGPATEPGDCCPHSEPDGFGSTPEGDT